MAQPVEFENIEEMRRQAGIDDAELRKAIGRLEPGDVVNLTVAARPATLIPVRITRIAGAKFRARLGSQWLSKVSSGASQFVTFTAAHIHSVARRQLRSVR